MYLAVGSHPDIAFTVTDLRKFVQNPGPKHITALKQVCRYLQGTLDNGITYSKSKGDLIPYTDSDWGEDREDRRSISGYVCTYAGGAITWSSKKQPTVALSTMEAEYLALAHSSKEALWLRALLSDLGLPPSGPTTLYTDNQSAIAFAHDSQFHARSKHIDIRHHFVRERVESKDIAIVHCSSEDNSADLFTKPLARPTHAAQLAQLHISTR